MHMWYFLVLSDVFPFSFECGSGDELTPHFPDTYFKLQGNTIATYRYACYCCNIKRFFS